MKTLSQIATCAALVLTVFLVCVGFVKWSRPIIDRPAYAPEAVVKKSFTTEMETIRTAAIRNGIEPGTEDWYILLAIRKAEAGASGREFGIMDARADNLDKQAGWCAASIRKNRERWDGTGDFVEFMGRRYCPVNADNDPDGLNVNWVGNVNYWKDKLKETE
jgi:hypothetical protein